MSEETTETVVAETTTTKKKCHVCGGFGKKEVIETQEKRARGVRQFENSVSHLARTGALERRPSCILCVQKHIGTAKAYHRELLKTKENNGKDGVAKISETMNFLDIIGELVLASEEAQKWEALQDAIIFAERQFRYYMTEPNWEELVTLIDEVNKTITTEEN